MMSRSFLKSFMTLIFGLIYQHLSIVVENVQ